MLIFRGVPRVTSPLSKTKTYTPRKIDMEPENTGPLEFRKIIWTKPSFSGSRLIFRGVSNEKRWKRKIHKGHINHPKKVTKNHQPLSSIFLHSWRREHNFLDIEIKERISVQMTIIPKTWMFRPFQGAAFSLTFHHLEKCVWPTTGGGDS